MAKKQYIVKMSGYLRDGLTVAKTSDATLVKSFKSGDGQFIVRSLGPNYVTFQTPTGTYPLKKHKSLNLYHGDCSGVKTHFIPKKVVAQLIIYWV